jgi:hypothetical protein
MLLKNLLSILCVTLCSSLMATTFTVSNNPNSPGQYTTITAALAAAAATGDIILVQGSATAYDDINITKSVKIYGAGVIPNTPSLLYSFIPNMTINASNITISGIRGSSVTVNSSAIGTRIEYNAFNVANISESSSNTTVINNRIAALRLGGGANNILILNNVLGSMVGTNVSHTNVIVKNNIFRNGTETTLGLNYDYNNYYGGATSPFLNLTNAGLLISDNVFYKASLGNITLSSFSKNVFTTIPNVTGNTDNANTFGASAVHTNFDGFQALPTDYNLSATGLAYSSSDNTQVGVNGGGFTFAMRGEAPIPYLRSPFNVAEVVVTSGGTLNVTVNATNGNQ